MPKYDFSCASCGALFEEERAMEHASEDACCPVCDGSSRRVFTMPRLLFKPDPRDVTPVWHKHDGYAHAHAPRRGRHRNPADDH